MRIPLFALLIALPFIALHGETSARDRLERQIHIASAITQIETHDLIVTDLAALKPSVKLDSSQEIRIRGLADNACTGTRVLIDQVTLDSSLASSTDGLATLDYLALAENQQQGMIDLIDGAKKPIKAKLLLRPALYGRNFLLAAALSLQGRPNRFSDGKKLHKDANDFLVRQLQYFDELETIGLPRDRTAEYEPFTKPKRQQIPDAWGFSDESGFPVRIQYRKRNFLVSGTGKEPQAGALNYNLSLDGDYTVLITLSLPDKLNAKKLQAYEDYSFGLKVATDASDDPAEFGLIEHQTDSRGFVQSFTATQDGIQDIFPHGSPSQNRVITNVITKSGDTLILGGILMDTDTYVETKVPVLGDLPLLGFYFRNGTKKTAAQLRNLIIFVTPHVVRD